MCPAVAMFSVGFFPPYQQLQNMGIIQPGLLYPPPPPCSSFKEPSGNIIYVTPWVHTERHWPLSGKSNNSYFRGQCASVKYSTPSPLPPSSHSLPLRNWCPWVVVSLDQPKRKNMFTEKFFGLYYNTQETWWLQMDFCLFKCFHSFPTPPPLWVHLAHIWP